MNSSNGAQKSIAEAEQSMERLDVPSEWDLSMSIIFPFVFDVAGFH